MRTPIIVSADRLPVVDEAAIQADVRQAFVQLAAGQAVQPQQVVTDLPTGGDVIAYQAVLGDDEVYAVKVSPYLPQPAGKPVVTAWTLLVSTRTGQPLVLVDAGPLTMERTAATTALAIDLLAKPDAATLAVIGWGPVGRAHLRHARAVREFTDARVYSPSTTAADLANLENVRLAVSADEAAQGADVVLLCTSAAAAVIDVRRLGSGTLVTSVSTNAPMAHEIDPAALLDLYVYADHTPAALAAAGEMRIAAVDHGFGPEHVRGDLPGLLTGSAPAPTGDKPVFFRSVGLGIEDAAVARTVLATLDTLEQTP